MNRRFLASTLSILIVLLGLQVPAARANQLPITASSALLLDSASNQVLFAKTPHLRRAPASTTKLLTAIVALNLMSPDATVVIPKYAESMQPSKIFVKAGERYTLRALLNAMLVNSANDGAAAIAIGSAGSIDAFARQMNKTARALGCQDSNFVNPNGLPDSRQYSTAYDMALIMREAERYPVIVQALKIRYGVVYSENGRRIGLKNHNKMLWRDSRQILGKTGWTIAAKHCFVGQIAVSGKKVFVSMLGSRRIWSDLKALADFQFGAALIKAYKNHKIKARENNKKIQTALKNSGFYNGTIDGKIGSKTRKAIRKFQKAHGLKQTGTVTSKTWQLLKSSL